MHVMKLVGGVRCMVNKVFFKHIGNLTYMGRPCFIEGRKNISIGNRTRIFSWDSHGSYRHWRNSNRG